MEIFPNGQQKTVMYGGKRKYNQTYIGPSSAYGAKLLKGGWMPSDLMLKRKTRALRKSARSVFGKTVGYSKYKKSEKRYVDSFGTVAVSTTPVFNLLNAAFIGGLWYQREGKTTKNLGLDLKIDVYNAGLNLTALDESTVRIMVLWDKMAQGTTTVIGDVLEDCQKAGTTQNIVLSNVNMNKRDRYEILSQEFVSLPAIGVSGAVSSLQQTNTTVGRSIQRYIKVNRQTEFNVGNNGDISDINSGALFLVIWADSGVDATPAFKVEYTTRLSFYE